MPKKAKWNEAPCPVCKEPCSTEALKCPHCQTEFTARQINERKKTFQNGMVGCGVLALILVFAVYACSGSDERAKDLPRAEWPAIGSASKEVTAASKEFAAEVFTAMTPCDDAGGALAEAVEGIQSGKTTAYEGFDLSDKMERLCGFSASRVREIKIPEVFTELGKAKAAETLENCSTAMLLRKAGAKASKKIFDGDTRPSTVHEVKQSSDQFSKGQMACVSSLLDVYASQGVKSDTPEGDRGEGAK